MSADNAYYVLVRITGCGSRPNPVQDEVRRTLESDGYECTAINVSPHVQVTQTIKLNANADFLFAEES